MPSASAAIRAGAQMRFATTMSAPRAASSARPIVSSTWGAIISAQSRKNAAGFDSVLCFAARSIHSARRKFAVRFAFSPAALIIGV